MEIERLRKLVLDKQTDIHTLAFLLRLLTKPNKLYVCLNSRLDD